MRKAITIEVVKEFGIQYGFEVLDLYEKDNKK